MAQSNAAQDQGQPNWEAALKRNPHDDFAAVQSSRPDFDSSKSFTYTKVPSPDWQPGSGANDSSKLSTPHVSIDPYGPGRDPRSNYKLLISGIVPRPIGFVSTLSADGRSTNLAPFSYFQVVNHDPPILVVGFSSSQGGAKDSLRNLLETKECVVNTVSEHFLEAANAASIDTPYGTTEWAVTGLHPAPCETVKASRVRESVFSIEGKLVNTHQFESKTTPGKVTGTMAIIEGTRFWVREDAVNEERSLIDPDVLRAVGRMGGITYVRTTDAMETPRLSLKEELQKGKGMEDLLKPKIDGQ